MRGGRRAQHTYPGRRRTSYAPRPGCLGRRPGCGSPESNLGEIGQWGAAVPAVAAASRSGRQPWMPATTLPRPRWLRGAVRLHPGPGGESEPPAEAPRAIAGLTATQARAQVCPGSLPFPTKLWVTLVVLPRDPAGLRALNLRSQAGPGHAPGISELGPSTWPQPWAGSRPRRVGPGTEPGPQGTVTIVIFKTHVVTTSC